MSWYPWRWLAGAGAAVVLAVLLLPAQRAGDPSRFGVGPESESAWRLWMDRSDSARTLQRVLDDAEALAQANARYARRGSGPLSVDPALPPEARTRFADAINAELASFPHANRGQVWVRVEFGARPTGGIDFTYVLPVRPEQPCVVIVSLDRRYAARLTPSDRYPMLGPCAFFGRYGVPGEGMLGWLRETRSYPAMLERVPATLNRRPGSRDDATVFRNRIGVRQGCAAGRLDWCERYFAAGPAWVDPTPRQLFGFAVNPVPPASRVSRAYPTFRRAGASNLASLRDAIGDPAFLGLWRSAEDPITAYRKTQGRELGSAVRDAVVEEYGPHEPGPMPPALPLAAGLALATAAALAAVRLTPRRQT